MGIGARAAEDMGLLRWLADANGVATGFWDWYGNRQDVSADSLLRILAALGVNVTPESTVDDIHRALAETEDTKWRNMLPPTVIAREGATVEIPVHVPHGQWVSVEWVDEEGNRGYLDQLDRWVEPRTVDGQLIGRATFAIPGHLPLGWHRLEATSQGGALAEATLIVVPNRLQVPTKDGKRRWGMSAQLYSTRSAASWGAGDAADLADLIAACAEKGADFLLINPVHACAPIAPIDNSPYLPVTRRWVNPLYIRPEAIEEFRDAPIDMQEAVHDLHAIAITSAANADLIDRDTSWESKLKALRLIFEVPRKGHREALFRHFISSRGEDLANFALWCALVEKSGDICLPANLRTSEMPGVEKARVEMAEEIEFWQWCQWIAAQQLEYAHLVGKAMGMDIGVMADLAVGVHAHGSEVWSDPHMFAAGVTVGAPPDMYSQQGQDWSQPPWSPKALAEAGYAPLRSMVRAAVANAGAVRIDHILGLFRLWWIPSGKGASAGSYVYYDHEAMVGIILLEAQRAGAQVIGEDLGTVEPWVRDYLRERGILGTSVLWFEKEEGGWPLSPERYRAECLAAVTTHDLPPTAGYIEGIQTTLRDELGLLVDDVETMREADLQEQDLMERRLRSRGLLGEEWAPVQERVEAMHAYLAQSPAQLVVAALVDAVGDKKPQNLPGTHKEYPNWCVPLCDANGVEVSLESLSENEAFASLCQVLNQEIHYK